MNLKNKLNFNFILKFFIIICIKQKSLINIKFKFNNISKYYFKIKKKCHKNKM